MTHFPIVRLPVWPAGGVAADALVKDISDWVGSEALTALVDAFDGRIPPADTATQLAYLDDFSLVWDGRAGGERLTARYTAHDNRTRELVDAAAPALGLAGRQRPATENYDHVLVLGGGLVTGRARARFAADLLAGGVAAATVTGLGSLRALPATAGNQEMGPGEHTEGDAMLVAVREAFPPEGAVAERQGVTADDNRWWVRTYPTGGPTVSVLAAPPTRPGQRANTADTLLGWADLVTRPRPTDRVLVVTTDLYVPFQHADAITVLGLTHRCGVETVGFSTRDASVWPKGPAKTGELLQELRSAIRSLRRLERQAVELQV